MQQAVRDALIGFMAATAQSQAEVIKEAQKAGIAHAQANDDGTKYRGRKPTFTSEQFTLVRTPQPRNPHLGNRKRNRTEATIDIPHSVEARTATCRSPRMVSRGIAQPKSDVTSADVPHLRNFLGQILPADGTAVTTPVIGKAAPLHAVGINDFLNLDVPKREMLLSPILPERSLAMLYAPRGRKVVACFSIG